MENQELAEIIKTNTNDVDGHHPIIVSVKNSNDEGKWVDLFRHVKYSGIDIYWPVGNLYESEISYTEFVDAFKKENLLIGLVNLNSTIPFNEIEKENQKIQIINWDTTGTLITVPIEYPDTKDQYHKGMISIKREFMTDHSTFIRIWSPGNSETTLCLFKKK